VCVDFDDTLPALSPERVRPNPSALRVPATSSQLISTTHRAWRSAVPSQLPSHRVRNGTCAFAASGAASGAATSHLRQHVRQ